MFLPPVSLAATARIAISTAVTLLAAIALPITTSFSVSTVGRTLAAVHPGLVVPTPVQALIRARIPVSALRLQARGGSGLLDGLAQIELHRD
jgi:hypothetical protein